MKRNDGRAPDQLREITMNLGIVKRANGSAEVRFGNTVALAAVHGPRSLFPRHLQESDTGVLRVRYAMVPFSVSDRKSPGHDRRGTEISKVARLALSPAIFLIDFPRAGVDAFIDIIQADGSTRVTGINALSLSLAAAGVPMRDLVTACSVGKVNDTLVADLNGEEDCEGQADVAVAILPNKNLVTLLQMDGILTREEIFKLLDMAKKSCENIFELQKKALKEKYKGED
jgi:exosome complex component RRP41